MKLAAVQFQPPKGQPDAARDALSALIDEAGRSGADLVVCPEMATTGYVWPSAAAIRPHAEPERGPTFQRLSPLARQHRAWVVCGFAEAADDGRLYNSALVIDPWGELARCYRKVLLYSADTTWAAPGTQRMTCETRFGRLAPAICMDLNDDDLIRFLHRSAAEVLAFCTNWVDEGVDVHPYWRLRLTRWPGWAVAANCWGEDEGVRFSGRSAILAPGGAVAVTAARTGDQLLLVDTAQIDVAALSRQQPISPWSFLF